MLVGVDYSLDCLKKHRSIILKVSADIGKLPFKNSVFDLATANMVVEHLRYPRVAFREIARVLKPGAVFLLHTPNLLAYSTMASRLIPPRLRQRVARLVDGRQPEDVFPTYYRANTRERIHRLAMASGFSVERIRMIVSSGTLVVFPPLAILELVFIRMLMIKVFKPLRTNIIGILRRDYV